MIDWLLMVSEFTGLWFHWFKTSLPYPVLSCVLLPNMTLLDAKLYFLLFDNSGKGWMPNFLILNLKTSKPQTRFFNKRKSHWRIPNTAMKRGGFFSKEIYDIILLKLWGKYRKGKNKGMTAQISILSACIATREDVQGSSSRNQGKSRPAVFLESFIEPLTA